MDSILEHLMKMISGTYQVGVLSVRTLLLRGTARFFFTDPPACRYECLLPNDVKFTDSVSETRRGASFPIAIGGTPRKSRLVLGRIA